MENPISAIVSSMIRNAPEEHWDHVVYMSPASYQQLLNENRAIANFDPGDVPKICGRKIIVDDRFVEGCFALMKEMTE